MWSCFTRCSAVAVAKRCLVCVGARAARAAASSERAHAGAADARRWRRQDHRRARTDRAAASALASTASSRVASGVMRAQDYEAVLGNIRAKSARTLEGRHSLLAIPLRSVRGLATLKVTTSSMEVARSKAL